MKKKVLLLASLCAIGICTWEAKAEKFEKAPYCIYLGDINMPNEFDKIDLRGDLLMNVGPNAIVAGASDDAVYIGFNQSFGNVNISIYNGMGGLVYNTVVNTDVQQVIIIPFTSAASGSYIVELSNASGYADGDFDKN